MGRRIDWYLVELERMLKGRVPAEDFDELSNETRAHLEAGMVCAEQQGASDTDRENRAVRAFGPPERLALAYMRAHSASTGRLPLLIAFLLAMAIYCMPIVAFKVGPDWLLGPGPLNASMFVWVWIGLGFAFVLACGAMGKRALLPISLGVAAGFLAMVLMTSRLVIVASYGELKGAVERSWAEAAWRAREAGGQADAELLAELKRGRKAFATANTTGDIPPEFRSGGRLKFPDAVQGSLTFSAVWKHTSDFGLARTKWASVFYSPLGEFERSLSRRNAMAEAYESRRSGPAQDEYIWAVQFWGPAALGMAAALSLVNLFVLWLLRSLELAGLRRRKLA